MPDEITPEIFEHLVDLAALELEPEDAAYLLRELNNQLAAVRILEQIPLDEGVEPAARGVPYPPEVSAPIRADEIIPSKERDAILAQAPEIEADYIVVPEIPHEELG